MWDFSLISILLRTTLTFQTCSDCQPLFDTSGSRLLYNRRVQVLFEQDHYKAGFVQHIVRVYPWILFVILLVRCHWSCFWISTIVALPLLPLKWFEAFIFNLLQIWPKTSTLLHCCFLLFSFHFLDKMHSLYSFLHVFAAEITLLQS